MIGHVLFDLNIMRITQSKFFCLWLYSPLFGLGRVFRFLIFYAVGGLPWTGDQPVAKPLPAQRIAKTQIKRMESHIQVGFGPTISLFEQAKTANALELAATVIGN
jgi:hypothetical protein